MDALTGKFRMKNRSIIVAANKTAGSYGWIAAGRRIITGDPRRTYLRVSVLNQGC